MNKQPLVSVCMITYGHDKYIQQAIESILIQETKFEYELVIANDCSPDDTDHIINNIIESHPKGNLITYYRQETNIGMMPNYAFSLNSCKGKYIAICDGDDYWSDSNKLQSQADFLEKQEDFVLVGHNAKYVKNNQELEKLARDVPQDFIDFTTSDLIKKNPFISSMVMFRNIGFDNIMRILDNFIVGDKAVYTLLSFHGKLRIYPKSVGYYRIHEESVTSSNRINYKPFRDDLINRINHAIFWNDYSKNEFNKETKEVIEYRSKVLTGMALWNLDIKTAIYYSQFVNLKDINKPWSRLIIKVLRLFS